MNYEVKKQIIDKIKEYDRIMLFRHVRPDGDCMGATKGMKRILQLSFPEKEILLIDSELPQYLAFMGPDDEPVENELYKDALGIVLDTASESRISNKNYRLCKELIKRNVDVCKLVCKLAYDRDYAVDLASPGFLCLVIEKEGSEHKICSFITLHLLPGPSKFRHFGALHRAFFISRNL